MELEEITRYSRQILLPEWGAAGQERIAAAEVEVRGHGAAAQAAVLYLAGAGAGAITTEAFVDQAAALNPWVKVHQRELGSGSRNGSGSEIGVQVVVANRTISGSGDRTAVGAAVAVE